MSRAPAAASHITPLIPAPRDEVILKQFVRYRFLTAREITALCYSKGSLTYARSRLSALAGNKDVTDDGLTNDYPLWRFGFPTGRLGNQEKIWCLSATGARIIERLGHPLPFYLKIAKLPTFSHSYLLHDLARNRFDVSLLSWAKGKANLTVESCLSYELSSLPAVVEIPMQRPMPVAGKMGKVSRMVKVSVIPDGIILVTNTHTGKRLVLLLEIDQNTLSEVRLRNHIASRLAYVRSSHFRATYGDIPSRIVYATQGVTESATMARLRAMCKITMKLLTERKREPDSRRFRFTTITFSTLYQDAQSLFEKAVWYRPDDLKLESPVPLFTDATPQPQKE
jgi:hypothetical protein